MIGNGPSALILSYILHGNIPTYDFHHPHPDALLHEQLKYSIDLLSIDFNQCTDHFSASRFSYSSQALPINVLFDTLNRPFGETGDDRTYSCIKWKHAPDRAISHVVVGNVKSAGGQWVDNPVKASWDIGTLSYGRMLSLPGYSFDQHFLERTGKAWPAFTRPSRRLVADYFATYPSKVGIEDTLHTNTTLDGVERTADDFFVRSHNIKCKHLVLASGTFSDLIPVRTLLQPLLHLRAEDSPQCPLLVIGSGFSAADVIISAAPSQKLIHVFKWAPETSPSPLKACHQQAYPEYAGVYRHMKLAALSSSTSKDPRPKARRTLSAFDMARDWSSVYEGLPNTAIIDVRVDGTTAIVRLQASDGTVFERLIGGLAYVVGRRGNLNYLVEELRQEVWPASHSGELLSGSTLRDRMSEDLEIAPKVFCTGSLTGDSLIRFAYGSCVFAASRILHTKGTAHSSPATRTSHESSPPYFQHVNGLGGHNEVSALREMQWVENS